MSIFTLSEQKTLVFHQTILELVEDHPNLLSRALKGLDELRSRKPEQAMLWDRWAALLDLPLKEMADFVLADTADGGLLRSNSPFSQSLSTAERSSIWQRIGLRQFMGNYSEAVDDLALELSEQAAITGIDAKELAAWQTKAPQEISKENLSRLKQIVSLQMTLAGINSDQEFRRRWLRSESQTLSATPISLLKDGKAGQVLESLVGAVQITMTTEDMPRMGN